MSVPVTTVSTDYDTAKKIVEHTLLKQKEISDRRQLTTLGVYIVLAIIAVMIYSVYIYIQGRSVYDTASDLIMDMIPSISSIGVSLIVGIIVDSII